MCKFVLDCHHLVVMADSSGQWLGGVSYIDVKRAA
jgi:hypothetical protein